MEIVNITDKPRPVPKVGELWKHGNDKSVYLRINDEHGAKALSLSASLPRFYSVNIASGLVYSTDNRDTGDIQILGTKVSIA